MKLKKRSKKHIKQTIKTNESSAPGPNRITGELVETEGEQLFYCLTHLMEACCFLGYSKTLRKGK